MPYDTSTVGFSLTVWVVPPVGVLVALAIFYLVLRMMRRSPATAPLGDLSAELSTSERKEYFRRIEATLDSADGKSVRQTGEAQSTTGEGASG